MFFFSILRFLTLLNHNCLDDTYRIDRLVGKENHPLSVVFLKDTSEAIVKEVYDAYVASKNGMVPLSEEQIRRLKEIADKMKNAPE